MDDHQLHRGFTSVLKNNLILPKVENFPPVESLRGRHTSSHISLPMKSGRPIRPPRRLLSITTRLRDLKLHAREDQARVRQVVGVDDRLWIHSVDPGDLPDPLSKLDHMDF